MTTDARVDTAMREAARESMLVLTEGYSLERMFELVVSLVLHKHRSDAIADAATERADAAERVADVALQVYREITYVECPDHVWDAFELVVNAYNAATQPALTGEREEGDDQ